jgi:BirA family biotin operon repressor/biotin-[acetyl-CoA-carboxylase] ligase
MSWDWSEEIGTAPGLSGDAIELAQLLEDVHFIRRVHFFEEVDSTSQWLLRMLEAARSPAGLDGTLVVADYQTHGRGRHRRSWQAPRDKAILMSVLLTASDVAKRLAAGGVEEPERYLAMIVPLAVVEAIRGETGLEATIKYPNDIMLGSRKCGGILIERSARFADAFVVGIGINVNQHADELPPTSHVPPTSLAAASGRHWNRWMLVRGILTHLSRWWYSPDGAKAAQKMNEFCHTVGRHVRVRLADGEIEGLAVGVSECGGLLVRLDTGVIAEVLSGDVRELLIDGASGTDQSPGSEERR